MATQAVKYRGRDGEHSTGPHVRAPGHARRGGIVSPILPQEESTGGLKRKLTIEQALVWAYRDQMVHAAMPQGVPLEAVQGYSPGLSEGRFMADKVDSSRPLGFGAAPDAYAIHAAVQALVPLVVRRSDEEVEMIFARKLMHNDRKALERMATGNATRPEMALTLMPRQIVQTYAMAGTRPDLGDDVQVSVEQGPRVYFDRHGQVVHYHTRFGFTVINLVGDDPLEVIAWRRLYMVWHCALASLLNSLSGLRTIALTGVLPPPPV
jgi:hypothetical protein